MTLTLFVTEHCKACDRVKLQLANLLYGRKDIKLKVEDITHSNRMGVVIVPALYIENELYAYGDLNEKKFLEEIKGKR